MNKSRPSAVMKGLFSWRMVFSWTLVLWCMLEVAPAQENFLAAGAHHAVARQDEDSVWTWGDNLYGQLGDGTLVDRLHPVPVIGEDGSPLTNVQWVSARAWHTVAVDRDNRVWAWGRNDEGQLGDGTFTQRSHAVPVLKDGGSFLGGVVQVACGEKHNLVLRGDGSVWAWGSGNDGQLGDDQGSDTPYAVRVLDTTGTILYGVRAVAAGRYHSLALKSADGSVWAWGSNSVGQVGAADNAPVYYVATPVAFEDGTPVTGVRAIAAGRYYSVAVTEGGTLLAWGSNDFGQFGDGTLNGSTWAKEFTPQSLDPNAIVQLEAGAEHSFTLGADGAAWVWGSNDLGQLGRPETQPYRSADPLPVVDGQGNLIAGVDDVAAGKYFSLLLDGASGQILSWGDNDEGQLGRAVAKNAHHVPAPVTFADGEPFVVFVSGNNTSATGSLTSPSGTVSGLVTVAAEAQDPDGLDQVYVTFVPGGLPLPLCGGGADAACIGTADSWNRDGVDPLDYGAAFGPITAELFVRDANGETLKVAERAFTLEEDGGGTFTLTVVKQGGGTGMLTSSPGGIACGTGCASESAPFAANTEIAITSQADPTSDFVGFAGERCYGLDTCTIILNRDLTVYATFELGDRLRVLSSVPADGDTGISTYSNVLFDFNRDIAPGPALDAIAFREVGGVDVPFYPAFPSRPDRLILGIFGDLKEGTEYEVILPAGAVEDLAGEPLPGEYQLRFTTAVFGAPRIFVSAYPRAIVELEETTVHVWFDRPQPYPRNVSLDSGDQLSHPNQVTIPADEIVHELVVTGVSTASDVIATLQVSEPESGTASVNVVVGDVDPVVGDPYQFVDLTFQDDEDHDGVFEAGEDAEFFVRVRNAGSDGISRPLLHISAVDISYPFLLKPLSEPYYIGYLSPGEVDGTDVTLRADWDLPTGSYYIRIEGTSDNGGSFMGYHVVEVINPDLPDFRLASLSGGSTFYVNPGTVLTLEYEANNSIDGGHPMLPPVEFTVVDSSGESVFERRTYADVRGEYFTQDLLELTLAVPNEPGTYTIEGTINPPPDPIPEDSSTDNDALPVTLIVELPNHPPVPDPVPAPLTVNACDDFALDLGASDPDGDSPLTFQLAQAPVGAELTATGPTTARLTWTPTAAQGPANEPFLVEVDDGRREGGTATVSFNVDVTRLEDLAITKTTPSPTAVPGGDISFTVTVTHEGSCGAPGMVVDVFDPRLRDVTWTCAATDGSSCTTGGSDELRDLALTLAKDGTATYTIVATIDDHARGAVMNTATVSTLTPVTDPVADNDSDSVTVTLLDLDFGDAPDASLGSVWSYPTRLADDGPRHGITGPRLGMTNDGEMDGQPSLQATADDQNEGDDEDGVTFLSSLVRCGDADVEVSLTGAGRLDAWFDWNVDSVWAADEKAFDSLILAAGTHPLTVSVPCTAADRSFARFRVSSAGGLLPTGLASDGEVEDYEVEIDPAAWLPLFSDGFESGDVSAWSSVVGLAARLLPVPAPDELRAQLLLAPGLRGRLGSRPLRLLIGLDGDGVPLFLLEVRRSAGAAEGIELWAAARDGDGWVAAPWQGLVGPEAEIELEWRRSLEPADDGRLYVSVGGDLVLWLTGLDNDGWDLKAVAIPAEPWAPSLSLAGGEER